MDTPLVIRSAQFAKAAVDPRHYPTHDFPEVAFAGRSNVGKSSLINCLVQRRNLVRTSRTPGRTQTINFFLVNDAFCFVDLPGYGFARVPESVRARWRPMVESYLTGRPNLRGIVHIMDARHLPTSDDIQLWQWLKSRRIPAMPILTKADKLRRGDRQSSLTRASETLGVPMDALLIFSATTGEGRERLWEVLTPWVHTTGP